MLGDLYVERLLPFCVQLKLINILDHSICAKDVQAEGHMVHRISHIVSLFLLLFLSMSVHFFLPFRIPSYFISLTTFFQRTYFHFFSFFLSCSFSSSFRLRLFLLILFHYFACSSFTNFTLFRGIRFVSSPKLSRLAVWSTQTLVQCVLFWG